MSGDDYDVVGILMGIKSDIGALNAKVQVVTDAMPEAFKRIREVERVQDKQAGAARVWALVGTAASGLVATAVHFMTKQHT